jgi:hypothetical protein
MARKKLARSTRAAREYKAKTKGTKVGTGKRFKVMVAALKKKGAKTPPALAAWIGRRKYGPGRMAKMAAAGRRRKG